MHTMDSLSNHPRYPPPDTPRASIRGPKSDPILGPPDFRPGQRWPKTGLFLCKSFNILTKMGQKGGPILTPLAGGGS